MRDFFPFKGRGQLSSPYGVFFSRRTFLLCFSPSGGIFRCVGAFLLLSSILGTFSPWGTFLGRAPAPSNKISAGAHGLDLHNCIHTNTNKNTLYYYIILVYFILVYLLSFTFLITGGGCGRASSKHCCNMTSYTKNTSKLLHFRHRIRLF